MRLLSIDPGRDTGWAFFDNGVLVECGLTSVGMPNCRATYLLCFADSVIVELPQVYRAAQSKGDPNDLIKVAVEVGQWKERSKLARGPCTLVHPAEWKKQVPKDIHHMRIMEHLYALERGKIPALPKTKAHNVLDAIGLGLWHLKRIR